jgi:hypothetical protein
VGICPIADCLMGGIRNWESSSSTSKIRTHKTQAKQVQISYQGVALLEVGACTYPLLGETFLNIPLYGIQLLENQLRAHQSACAPIAAHQLVDRVKKNWQRLNMTNVFHESCPGQRVSIDSNKTRNNACTHMPPCVAETYTKIATIK